MKPIDSQKLLYKSRNSFIWSVLCSAYAVFVFYEFYAGSVFPSTILRLVMLPFVVLLACIPLIYTKLFDVYEEALIVKYPKVLMLKETVIELRKVKKIVFKLRRGKGANHTMILEYHDKKIKYRFWSTPRTHAKEIIKHLQSTGANIEVIKVLNWFEEQVEK